MNFMSIEEDVFLNDHKSRSDQCPFVFVLTFGEDLKCIHCFAFLHQRSSVSWGFRILLKLYYCISVRCRMLKDIHMYIQFREVRYNSTQLNCIYQYQQKQCHSQTNTFSITNKYYQHDQTNVELQFRLCFHFNTYTYCRPFEYVLFRCNNLAVYLKTIQFKSL